MKAKKISTKKVADMTTHYRVQYRYRRAASNTWHTYESVYSTKDAAFKAMKGVALRNPDNLTQVRVVKVEVLEMYNVSVGLEKV